MPLKIIIPSWIQDLCRGFIRNNFNKKGFPINLGKIIITYFLKEMKLSYPCINFCTSDFISITRLLTSRLLSFKITNAKFVITMTLNQTQIEIYPTKNKYRVMNNNNDTNTKFEKIKSISNQSWNFGSDTNIFLLSINRKTQCECNNNSNGSMEIYICKHYNKTVSIKENIMCLKQNAQIRDYVKIEMQLNENFMYQSQKLVVTTYNAMELRNCDNQAPLFASTNKRLQTNICCYVAHNEALQLTY